MATCFIHRLNSVQSITTCLGDKQVIPKCIALINAISGDVKVMTIFTLCEGKKTHGVRLHKNLIGSFSKLLESVSLKLDYTAPGHWLFLVHWVCTRFSTLWCSRDILIVSVQWLLSLEWHASIVLAFGRWEWLVFCSFLYSW